MNTKNFLNALYGNKVSRYCDTDSVKANNSYTILCSGEVLGIVSCTPYQYERIVRETFNTGITLVKHNG